jgi:HPt (histidine-containing phosphotransfer) domain-containing protein
VNTLEADLGPELYGELLSDFLGQLMSQGAHLRQADEAEPRDLVGARSIAHQLKGTAPAFGAGRLEDLATGFLESTDSHEADLGALIDEVDAEISRLQAPRDV